MEQEFIDNQEKLKPQEKNVEVILNMNIMY